MVVVVVAVAVPALLNSQLLVLESSPTPDPTPVELFVFPFIFLRRPVMNTIRSDRFLLLLLLTADCYDVELLLAFAVRIGFPPNLCATCNCKNYFSDIVLQYYQF